jgi:hypothetical protein
LLDRSFEEGGVGLYKQTAQNFSQKIETILTEADFLQKEIPQPKRPKTPLDVKVQHLRKYLLDGYKGSLKKEEELIRLEHFIRLKIEGKITKKQFQKYLDLPFRKGGVGLNRQTAKVFAKRLELALINY